MSGLICSLGHTTHLVIVDDITSPNTEPEAFVARAIEVQARHAELFLFTAARILTNQLQRLND